MEHTIYRKYQNGVVALNTDLSIDANNQLGDYPNIYSSGQFDDFIFLGISDNQAPDTVAVLKSDGTIFKEYIVGALPGSFGVYLSD